MLEALIIIFNFIMFFDGIHSGIDLDRNNFNELLDDVIKYKIKNVYITFKDRLTRLSFKTLESLFKKYQTNIIEFNNTHTSSNDYEIFEELMNLMHIFSTTMPTKKIIKIKNNILMMLKHHQNIIFYFNNLFC
jgi:predicted site-specific integrase-resolvase